jgi:hypothetical protein
MLKRWPDLFSHRREAGMLIRTAEYVCWRLVPKSFTATLLTVLTTIGTNLIYHNR